MDQRVQFVAAWKRSERSVAALCRAFGISRQTGHKWIRRYREGGPKALEDASRRPRSNPRATDAALVELVLEVRRSRGWGPKKIRAYIGREYTPQALPAASTIGEILTRHGLVKPRRRRGGAPPRTEPFGLCTKPNDVWGLDFKGDFRMGDRTRCYPLMVTDAYSRYLLCCKALRGTQLEPTKKALEVTFREFGLPRAIRTDNGTPFASHGAGGLTRLAVWLLKLGIQQERIDPGRPDQNGRHERMHRTLKAATARPPARGMRTQQRAFNRFRAEFNEDRPHEALGQETPASHYTRSERPFPKKLESPIYPGHYEVRRVHPVGQIGWKQNLVFVSGALAGEDVGLEEYEDGLWRVHFGRLCLGVIDQHEAKPKLIRPYRKRPNRGRRP